MDNRYSLLMKQDLERESTWVHEVHHILPEVELGELRDGEAGPAPQAHAATVRGAQPVGQVTSTKNNI